MDFTFQTANSWSLYSDSYVRWAFQGDIDIANEINEIVKSNRIDSLASYLKKVTGQFSVIVETDEWTVGVVDHARTIPIFYSNKTVSNKSTVGTSFNSSSIDQTSLLEIIMAGYSTSNRTLFCGHYQLCAGEYIAFNKRTKQKDVIQYYRYNADVLNYSSENDLIEELSETMTKVVNRVIENAQGQEIWVPLSAGLDSRLILCKLHELKYDRLYSFSYGKYSNEAKYAKEIAKKLNVDWTFYPSSWKKSSNFFDLKARKEYWKFSSDMACIPNTQDLIPLYHMLSDGVLDKKAYIVNGQSGDFITGGHVPASFANHNTKKSSVFAYILTKHFSLWKNYVNKSNIFEITKAIEENYDFDIKDSWRLYEYWEYRERQTKFVVNGQRVYDFLGLNWRLPFWDQDLIRFWSRVPIEHKLDQGLYRKYLKAYNYMGLFKNERPLMKVFTGPACFLLPLVQLAGLLFGKACKMNLLSDFHYFDRYHYQYVPFSYSQYKKYSGNIRNSISLQTMIWVKDVTGIDIHQ